MIIKLKNKDKLLVDDFVFKCCIGKNGKTNNKTEGDNKTPKGIFSLGNIYFRKDRNKKPISKLNLIPIKKKPTWWNAYKYTIEKEWIIFPWENKNSANNDKDLYYKSRP